jgi:hypothetical protein
MAAISAVVIYRSIAKSKISRKNFNRNLAQEYEKSI